MKPNIITLLLSLALGAAFVHSAGAQPAAGATEIKNRAHLPMPNTPPPTP